MGRRATHCKVCSVRLDDENAYHRKDRPTFFRGTCKACLAVKRRIVHDAAEERRRTELLDVQTEHCAICKSVENVTRGNKVRRPTIDHCHETGLIRGVLCSRCNTGIGMFQDDPALLREAAVYLDLARVVAAAAEHFDFAMPRWRNAFDPTSRPKRATEVASSEISCPSPMPSLFDEFEVAA